MRRSAVIGILAVLFIIWLVVVAYLAVPGAPPAPAQSVPSAPVRQPVDVGLSAVTGSGSDRFALETVNPMVLAYPIEALNGSVDKEIYSITGNGVDAGGRATSWMYGIRYAGGTSFLIFDENGWRSLHAKDTFSGTRIETGSLVNMSRLFAEHPDLFASANITDRQVEISENTARVTVREGTALPRIYTFDATTGALI